MKNLAQKNSFYSDMKFKVLVRWREGLVPLIQWPSWA